MTRHPASVYRAAREGYRHTLAAVFLPLVPPWIEGPHAATLRALAGVAHGKLKGARNGPPEHMTTAELAAYVLGASAVPAVLRVRAAKAAMKGA